MSNSGFAHLDWAFATNKHDVHDQLYETYRKKTQYLSYLNELIYFLGKYGCKGIQEKISDCSHLFKFQSILSELETARVLLERGKSVELLPDNYMRMESPPDLLVEDDEVKAYVEVKHILEDLTVGIILEDLRQFLCTNNYLYRVDIEFNEIMSLPVIRWQERQHKEDALRNALQEVKTRIKALNSSSLPVGIETKVGKFKIHQSSSGKGYPGVIRTAAITVPDKKYIEKICFDVCTKAKKRDKWTGDHRTKIYIVALDFTEIGVYDRGIMEVALIGHRIKKHPISPMPDIRETKEVTYAKERGWEHFLRETCIIPRNRTYLDSASQGIFFTEPNVKNVSGVIGKFGKELHFVPNPFSFDEINDPRLMNYI